MAMIRVIEGLKVKDFLEVQPILLKIRANAMQYPGYVGSEFLIDNQAGDVVVVISTWMTSDSWRLWEKSQVRADLYQQAESVILEEPRLSIFRVIPTQAWS